ncbi:MAG TPA: hypothetical protein DCM28_20840 [Phycisphaerales bacterium]|nr:hypothetical protein [Phycisphaerales bacterium]HCD31325.1 hypothetical protein [Phycisphaerales bacterium]|tara:strand:+ start:62881 stop:64062 length:1182 start_codon:yes stop_codon:yes gene_type:complete
MPDKSFSIYKHSLTATRASPDDGHYFFGYFDKYQFDLTGRYLLVNKAKFMDRQPTADDELELGVIDLDADMNYRALTQTRAWCWQQGCMLQWLPGSNTTQYIYNDCRNGRFVSVIADIFKGAIKTIPLPVYCLSPDGCWAASTNFSRLATERPGYGYEGVADSYADQNHPKDDGIYIMDMLTGEHRLIVSLDRLANVIPKHDSFACGPHWTNHLLFSPDSKRLVFLHRWRLQDGTHQTRMFTTDINGENLYLLNDQVMTSHMTWVDSQHIVAFANQKQWGYYLFTDQSPDVAQIGQGQFDGDGHCSCPKDSRWLLTDTYPDKQTNERTLILYDRIHKLRHNLGDFASDSNLPTPVRCDLHPRWDRFGQRVTFDSIHEGFRGVYLMDLATLITR